MLSQDQKVQGNIDDPNDGNEENRSDSDEDDWESCPTSEDEPSDRNESWEDCSSEDDSFDDIKNGESEDKSAKPK